MGFSEIGLALVPVAALLAFGFGLKRTPLFSNQDFWTGAERLAYFVLLPTLLFRNVATVDLTQISIGPLAAALVLPTLAVSLLLIAAHRATAPDARAFTSVFQGSIRFNTYIGLSVAATLFGESGAALAAIVGAILVPVVNIASALVFEYFLVDKHSWLALLRSVVLNPLVLGCAAGVAWSLVAGGMPELASGVLDPLAAAALPIGLLCVGAGLRPISIGAHGRGLAVSSAVKLVVLPAVTVVSLRLFGITGEPAMVGLVFQSIATASSAYVMSRQLGGNAPLMAAIIALQTLASLVLLPPVLAIGFRLLA
ncbi:AEC family transporter [Brevibacterium daeguense]|uniref:AEC family transporter n=1 Tax=Brevibacterium daeguense TaxID=909936 RepID=A0ABP8ENM9_9MICO|nr:AEC family transporter [Brevibacterium daeguense]